MFPGPLRPRRGRANEELCRTVCAFELNMRFGRLSRPLSCGRRPVRFLGGVSSDLVRSLGDFAGLGRKPV
jgi:hypothetical protein